MAVDWSYLWGAKGANGFGSRSTAEEVTQGLDISSYTVIVTGSTSGIGLETARVLALRGAHVVIPARCLKSAKRAKEFILSHLPDARIDIGELDLTSLSSIHKFVDWFNSLNTPLHILINNAGIVCKGLQRSETGMEIQFATNHLGHFLLTKLFLEKMISTSEVTGIEGRIVNVSSKEHMILEKGMDIQTLGNEASDYTGPSTWKPILYARSKLANILHVKELSRQLQNRGVRVTANALHPGVVRTPLTRNLPSAIRSYLNACSLFMRSVPQGAATTCYVATHPSLKGVTGKYFDNCNEAECSSVSSDTKLAKELWNFSETFIKQHETNI